MPILLRQSTASQEVPLGVFLDSSDGNTEKTALTIANTDIKIWKTGATTLATKNSGGATHISNGIYYAVLDDTDTDTLGSMIIFVHVSGALVVRLECLVLTAVEYDSRVAGTDYLQVDIAQWNNSNIASPDTAGYPKVTVKSGTGTGEISLASGLVDITQTAADKVWSTASRTLTGFGTLVSDIWSAGTRTLTAISDSSGITTLLSRIASAITITGGKVDVNDKTGFDLISAYDAAKTAATQSSVDAIKAKTDNLPDDPADESLIIAATNAILAVLGTPNGASIAADILTRLASSSYVAPLTAAQTRSAIGLASANLDTQLSGINTNIDDTETAIIDHGDANWESDSDQWTTDLVAGGYVGTEAGAVILGMKAKLDSFGVGEVVIQSPVTESGEIEITVGDGYYDVDGRGLRFVFTNAPDLTGSTARLRVTESNDDFSLGEVIVVGTVESEDTILFEPTSQDTSAWLGGSRFEVEITLSNGHVLTLIPLDKGVATINPQAV